MQTKSGEGNERRTNLARIVRSQQEFLGEKIRKRQEQGAAMFGAAAPVLPYLGHAPLKVEGAKMVTCLINASPLSNKRRRALANARRLLKARLR
jgi:hypothetical protein